ncbi:MAG: hypothetical protein MRQ09_00685 [Candidatus Midichloria sp.]|nr:hypothetical protein [Candidatus Midichloria sp.]
MTKLYGNTVRWITNIASIIASIGVVTLHATAIGYILHYFYQVPISYSIIICISVLALYSAFVRIRAVAYTDVFQFMIIILANPCSLLYCI